MKVDPVKNVAGSLGPNATELNTLASLFQGGRFQEMEVLARGLSLRFPEHGAAYMALGTALAIQGRLADAVVSMQKATILMPNNADAHCNLGNMWQDQRRFVDAAACYRQAVTIRPDFAEAHSYLGLSQMELGQLDLAEASCRRAIEISGDNVNAHGNLGIVLHRQGRLDEAELCFRRRLQLRPGCVQTLSSLSNVLKLQGRHAEAYACLRSALDIDPANTTIRSTYLFSLGYDAEVSLEYRLGEAKRYGQIVDAKCAGHFSTWLCAASPKRLRVGMVSGDFREHPVGHFLEGPLSHIDRDRIELVAYPTKLADDELATRIKRQFSQWKPLVGYSDAEAARLIHADGVHVLVDLAGHSAYNRLPIFAWKPAPVQISWLGDFATTGVAQMDYLLVDGVGAPKGAQSQFTETLWYFPDTRLCFTAPQNAPPIAPLPALVNGYVTFGCFQNLAKLSDDVLSVWSSILATLPNTRLRMQSLELGFPATRELVTRRMESKKIDPSRVMLYGSVKREAYLAAYAEVDMILDTFPYPGGTTTCEALWMGVPTLTLAGDSLHSRGGASILTATGLQHWVTTSKDDYVRKAAEFASDIVSLAALRQELRQQVASSPAFDAPRFARHFQDALWDMWQRHAPTQQA